MEEQDFAFRATSCINKTLKILNVVLLSIFNSYAKLDKHQLVTRFHIRFERRTKERFASLPF